MNSIRFFAPGKAEPAGSKKSFTMRSERAAFLKGATRESIRTMTPDQIDLLLHPEKLCRSIVTDDNPEGEKWKKIVAAYARTVHTGAPLSGPLQLDVTFTLERPQGHFGSGKNAGNVKDSAPEFPIVRPDTTKLLRCLEDGLTGVLWIDDAQIVRQVVSKEYGPKPGALVHIAPYVESLF